MKNDELNEYPGRDSLGRRDFIKLLGLGGGILVSVPILDEASLEAQERRRGPTYPEDFNAYLLIAPDGKVTGFSGKIEQGQGPLTALPQMIADELDVAYDDVHMILGDTDLCPEDMGTFGSLCIRMFGPALRAAAAEARAVLLELASEKLKLPVDRLAVENGVVYDKSDKKSKVTYGELAAGKRIERHVATKPSPKPVAEWKVMGRPQLKRESRDKVTGKALFAGDVRVPGMLYARVLRPPAHGATLKAVDASEAEKIPGLKVLRDGELVAALHEQPDVAAQALAKIKADYEPSPSKLDEQNIYDHLVKVAPEPQSVAQGGDLAAGAAASTATIESTYLNTYVAHSAMETHTALVKIDGDKATVWPSSQTPFGAKTEVAGVLGLEAKNVRVISPFVGGGFGGKTFNLQATQAARLAKLAGRPVQVAWSRGDEFFFDTFRPAAVVKIKSGIDKNGSIVLWDYIVYFAGNRSSAQFYDVPNHRTLSAGEWGGRGAASGAHPFRVGAWRAPGSNTNVFARESQIDIMAAKAGLDPLEFRMKNLAKDERMRRALQAVADKFGWKPAPAPSGRGLGLACADYSGTYVATMAEVAVDKATGAVQVKRVVCAQDMGQCVNPEGATIQMEGCITMGLGYALTEEVHFKDGRILDQNYDSYEIPRFSWLPKIETVLIKNDDLPFSGGGEPAIINMGAVLANAVFDATGARLYQLPMTRERVKAALGRIAK